MNNRTTNILFAALLFLLAVTDLFNEISVWLYVLLAVAYVSIQAFGSIVLSSNFFVNAISKGGAHEAIALTFDDGPVPGKTDRILEILRRHDVRGAFFCIGKNVTAHPELIKRIHADGHIIGNHSFFHGKLFDLQPANSILKELLDTDDVIVKHTGVKPRFFRPPYGVTNPMVANAIQKGNYVTVGWSLRSFDTTAKNADALFERVSSKPLNGGDIILFHDYSEPMIAMLPKFIEMIKNKGLKIVALDQLLNEKAYV